MFAMSPTVTLKGAVKFSVKKLLAGGEMATSTYTGPGELLLAPAALGDITSIRLSGNEVWSVGKDAFLAATQGVVKDYKAQGFGKAMFSGEGLFVYKMSGQGIMWLTSLGAIIRKDVRVVPSLPCLNGIMRVRKLTKMVRVAATRGEIHRRQRPSRGLELQVCPRARCQRRHHIRPQLRRRTRLQVHRSAALSVPGVVALC